MHRQPKTVFQEPPEWADGSPKGPAKLIELQRLGWTRSGRLSSFRTSRRNGTMPPRQAALQARVARERARLQR